MVKVGSIINLGKMSKYLKIFLFTALSFSLISPASANQPTLPKAEYVLPQELKVWLKEGKTFTFIDVREPVEYEAGHLEGAVNIPYLEVENQKDKFKPGELYIFYCTYSSWRAPYAANVLKDMGYEQAYILSGGASAWNAGGQVIYASRPGVKPAIIPYRKDMPHTLYHPKDRVYEKKIDLTLQELSNFDGKNGRPAYVAVNGIIYDLTESRLWRGGEHDPAHGEVMAGQDLTELLEKSPHGDKHLKGFPVVGRLILQP